MLPGDGDFSLGMKQTFLSAFPVLFGFIFSFSFNSVECPKQAILLHPLAVAVNVCCLTQHSLPNS